MKSTLITVVLLIAIAIFAHTLTLHVESEHPPIITKMKLLALQLAVILVAAKGMGALFESYLHQPAVLGELLSGVVIGPYALGKIHIGLLHGPLFAPWVSHPGATPFAATPELYGIATVAAILLLFLAGLETDFQQFIKRSFAGTLVGVGGVLGAFVLGDLLTVWMVGSEEWVIALNRGKPLVFMSPIAMFMGTISVATSVGITARVLSEMGQLDSPEGTTVLAGAVIDDVLGIVILAIVVGLAGSASGEVNWNEVGKIGYKAVGFWLSATVIGVICASKIAAFLSWCNRGTLGALGVALALLLGGLAEAAGLAAIIGAYAIGLALSKERISHDLEEMLMPVYQVLVPVFFCVMGMMVDIKAMFDPSILTFSIVFTLVAIVAKVVGCALPTFLAGFNAHGALRIGIGMLPRGEVALIVAGVGMASGAIEQRFFGVSILMTLVTTLMAPPILVRIFDPHKPGLRGVKPPPKLKPEHRLSIENLMPEISMLVIDQLTREFENEGWVVKLINPDARIYAITKDDELLELKRSKTEMHFDMASDSLAAIHPIIQRALDSARKKMTELTVTDQELPPAE